ncbi:translation elongation factor Ts [Wenzhouxiangella sp. XN24]|uniref:translation elongation factor Ts n=1 Tax=Wenzhouxiangella sp. XN24 TaxID=2713569 RepID=UPI0013EB90AF|nr:translation elongation factor Ts [Wenzhouxiangella sp. XN24]NGX16795.1 elongation factor Ts [Wenzhouxiangella sp. XN24]
MSISASLVKELRERTGAGMMECKRALVETDGDIEAAIEHMRKQGLAKADKKAGRIAAEGLVVVKTTSDQHTGVVVEINCETDFVAGGDDFKGFADTVGELVLEQRPADLEALLALPLGDSTVEETRRGLVAKLGENIGVRRFAILESTGTIGSYLHGTRIGVLVAIEGGDEALVRDLAMHVAASRPQYIDESEIPGDFLDKEREILVEQAKGEGKPAEIVARMVEGRLRKQLAEITLVGQPFVKDPDTTVGKLLSSHDATVAGFVRFEVGEGIEKKADNFVEEVMAQVRGG